MLGGLIALVMKLLNLKCEVLSPYHSRGIAIFTQNLPKNACKWSRTYMASLVAILYGNMDVL